jgi:hypothetical protein
MAEEAPHTSEKNNVRITDLTRSHRNTKKSYKNANYQI